MQRAEGNGNIVRIEKAIQGGPAGPDLADHRRIAQALLCHGLLNLTGDHALDRGEEYFVETIKQSPAYYAEAHDNLQKAKALAYQSAGPEFEHHLECR